MLFFKKLAFLPKNCFYSFQLFTFCAKKKSKPKNICFQNICSDLDFENYIKKLSDNGIMILEGGSIERDNVEWMLKYNKPKINPVVKKYSYKYSIKLIKKFPSITIIKL